MQTKASTTYYYAYNQGQTLGIQAHQVMLIMNCNIIRTTCTGNHIEHKETHCPVWGHIFVTFLGGM